MKELYRDREYTLVAYYKTLLESEGIPIMLRNGSVGTSGITEIPIPEFFPNICVMHDEDYDRAHRILTQIKHGNAENSEREVICPSCGEINPGNFEICFSCEAPLPDLPDLPDTA